jgi:hypothetical protein
MECFLLEELNQILQELLLFKMKVVILNPLIMKEAMKVRQLLQ